MNKRDGRTGHIIQTSDFPPQKDGSRRIKNWRLAEFTAEQMLGFDVNYAGSYYEMGMVKVQSGHAKAARSELQKSIELWKNADFDLDELRQATMHLGYALILAEQTRIPKATTA